MKLTLDAKWTQPWDDQWSLEFPGVVVAYVTESTKKDGTYAWIVDRDGASSERLGSGYMSTVGSAKGAVEVCIRKEFQA